MKGEPCYDWCFSILNAYIVGSIFAYVHFSSRMIAELKFRFTGSPLFLVRYMDNRQIKKCSADFNVCHSALELYFIFHLSQSNEKL